MKYCFSLHTADPFKQVQSQDEVIEALMEELKQGQMSKLRLEEEFAQYRVQMQASLLKLAAEGAEQWLKGVEEKRSFNQTSSSDEESTK